MPFPVSPNSYLRSTDFRGRNLELPEYIAEYIELLLNGSVGCRALWLLKKKTTKTTDGFFGPQLETREKQNKKVAFDGAKETTF